MLTADFAPKRIEVPSTSQPFGEFPEIVRKEKPEESTNEEGSDEKHKEAESENAEDES